MIIFRIEIDTDMFKVRIVEDVAGVSMCGALKSKLFILLSRSRIPPRTCVCDGDSFFCGSCWPWISILDIVAVGAGFVDGLEWGDNAKGMYSSKAQGSRSHYEKLTLIFLFFGSYRTIFINKSRHHANRFDRDENFLSGILRECQRSNFLGREFGCGGFDHKL